MAGPGRIEYTAPGLDRTTRLDQTNRQPAVLRQKHLITEILIQLDLARQHDLGCIVAGRIAAKRNHHVAIASRRQGLIAQHHGGRDAVLRMNLGKGDQPVRRHLGDSRRGGQHVIRSAVGPVTQSAVGEGLAQLTARVGRVGGRGAVDRRPEKQLALLGLKVVILIPTGQNGGGNNGGGNTDRDSQVPGGQIDHGDGAPRVKRWSTPDLSMAVPASLRALRRRISAHSAAVNDHPSPCWRYFFDFKKHDQLKKLSPYSSLRNFPSEAASSAPKLTELAPTSAFAEMCASSRFVARRAFLRGRSTICGGYKRTPGNDKAPKRNMVRGFGLDMVGKMEI